MGKTEAFLEHADAIERGLLDIGHAAKASGVSVKMIRHYEAIGLLKKVARTFANHRVYTANDVHTLRFIKRARTLGFPVQDIRELLSLWQSKGRSSAAVKKIARGHVESLRLRVAELQSMWTRCSTWCATATATTGPTARFSRISGESSPLDPPIIGEMKLRPPQHREVP